MKMTKLSIIAASAILGSSLLFTGCDSDSSSGSSVSSSITPVKGYILEGTATATNGTPNKDKNGTMTNGKFVFAGGLGADYNVTVDKGAWVDADDDDNISKTAGIDFTTSKALKTTGDASVATSLTTYAMENAGNGTFNFKKFMAIAKNFNPVAELASADNNTTAALIVLASVLDEIVISDGNFTDVSDINISALTSVDAIDDINFSKTGKNASAAEKVKLAKSTMILVQAAKKAGISPSEIQKLFIKLVDAKLPVSTVMNELVTGDVNTTAFDNVVSKETTALNDARKAVVDATPAKIYLTSNEITVGGEKGACK